MTFTLFLIALPVFFAIDMVWLGVVARRFYRTHLGAWLAPTPNWTAAVVFYLLFILGLVVFVIGPAVDGASWTDALWRGAFFGLVTYATYDLTNHATMRDWPPIVTVVDMAWGSVLAASVAVATYALADVFGV
jgi:uncharacterized membrane protein